MYVQNQSILRAAIDTDGEVDYLRNELTSLRAAIDGHLHRANNAVRKSILLAQDLTGVTDDAVAREIMQQMRDAEFNASDERRDALSVHEDLVGVKLKLAILTGDQSQYL